VPNPTSCATKVKAERLADVMRWLPPIQAEVIAKPWSKADNTLIYIDGMAGCGINPHGRDVVDGSTMIMASVLNDLHQRGHLRGLCARLYSIERDWGQWSELTQRLDARRSEWAACEDRSLDIQAPLCGRVGPTLRDILWGRLARNGNRPIYGLLFLDPQKPSELTADLGDIKGVFRESRVRLDPVLNVASTAWKRTSRANGSPSLTDVMDAISRNRWMISEKARAFGCGWGWHVLIGTNGTFKDWSRRGFHDVESERGEALMREATMTKEELRAEGLCGQLEIW
jgi:hypothetical protein